MTIRRIIGAVLLVGLSGATAESSTLTSGMALASASCASWYRPLMSA